MPHPSSLIPHPSTSAAQPSLVYCPHPILAAANRRIEYSVFLPGESIQDYLDRLGIQLGSQPVVLHLNDRPIPWEEWPLTVPKQGDLITIRAIVREGALRTVLTIVVLIIAIYTQQYWALEAGTAWGAVAGAAVVIGGNLLINALLPLPNPNLAPNQGLNNPSPTYALTGGSNRARPFEPLPLLMGRHRMFPDLGAQPYTEFEGDDQMLYHVFNFGLTHMRLTDFRIGNTPVESFDGVTIERSGADGVLTLFPSNVDTTAGGALTAAAGWVQKTSGLNAKALAVEITGLLYYLSTQGSIVALSATIEIEYRKVGATPWLPFVEEIDVITGYHTAYWSAGYSTTDPDDGTVWHQITYGGTAESEHTPSEPYVIAVDDGESLPDYQWTYRPYSQINGGVQGSTPLRDPAPEEAIKSTVNGAVIASASRKPLRRTYHLKVEKAQYEVRVRRFTPDETDPRAVSDIAWSQLRTYQPDTADYTGQQRVGVKILASGQLQGTLQQFSAEASGITQVWHNDIEWASQETSNPAWWVLRVLRGRFVGTRKVYGGGLPDSRIDLDNLKAFAAWCDAKALTFDGVIDRPMNCLDLGNAIARCGRGSLTQASGKYGVTWDAPGQPVVAVFGMGNIKLDTFRCSWISEKLGDEIVLEFVNPDLGWQQDTVRATVPGVIDPVNPVKVNLFGCTDKDMAGREVNLIAAAQRYRRRFVSFEADFEGHTASRGDVVMVSHDLFAMQQLSAWGRSGRLVAGTTMQLTLDAKVPFTPATQHYVAVRYPDATLTIRPVTLQVGEADVIALGSALPAAPDADPNGHPALDYLWFFGLDATGPGKKMKVHGVEVLSESDVRLTLVDENPDYYAAESNGFVYTPPAQFTAQLPVISNLELTEDLVKNGNGFAVKLTLTWDVTGNYDHANVRLGLDDAPLTPAGTTSGRRLELIVPDTGAVDIEVSVLHPLFGAGPGSTATVHHPIIGKAAPPADVTGFTHAFSGPDTVLAWGSNPEVDIDEYEIVRGAGWATGIFVGRGRALSLKVGALAAATTYWIKAIDTSGNYSINAASHAVTPAAPGQVAVSAAFDGGDVRLTWPTPATTSYPIALYEARHGATFAGGTSVGYVDVTTFRALAIWSGSRTWWVQAIDAAGTRGAPGSVEVVVTPPSQPAVLAEVIDNNVLLRWINTPQTLPKQYSEIRRGDVFASATVIGTVQAGFAVIFESSAGTYRYWVVDVDSAGNYGAEGSIVTSVAAPPDYVLFDNIVDDFSGTKINALAVDGRLLVMADPALSYDNSFGNEGWASWQAAIDAGFPIYMQKGEASGQYVKNIDYGTVLPATKITVDMGTTVVSGATTTAPTISIRKLITDPWIDFVGQWSVYATDFRYIKVTLDFAGAGRDDLMFVDTLTTRLDVKLKGDAMTVTANSGDAGGTTVYFNVDFVDVHSITATAQGTTPAVCVVDFTDVPNPTSFKLLAFDLAGSRITRDVRCEINGV